MSMVLDHPVETCESAPISSQYARSDLGRSLRSLATSVLPFLVLWAAMFAVYSASYWLVLLLAIPAAGFLVRTYIMFHDCVHGSLLSTRRANTWLGTALGLLVFTPFARWRYEHLVHHATAGDLDRRFIGDVPMLTVAEYESKPWWFRAGYRALPAPVRDVRSRVDLLDRHHAADPDPGGTQPMHRSVWAHQRSPWWCSSARCASAFGWQTVLFVELPLVVLAGSVGSGCSTCSTSSRTPTGSAPRSGASPTRASVGSSHLALPRVLQFFSGNIGFHHVHHLNPKIPNYNLPRAHEEQPAFRSVPSVSFADGLRATQLKLWDEQSQQMVTWKQARAVS